MADDTDKIVAIIDAAGPPPSPAVPASKPSRPRAADPSPKGDESAATLAERWTEIEGERIANDALAECAALDHSDTDNGRRLDRYFGGDLTVLAQSGAVIGDWLAYTGTHWDWDGGAAGVRVLAQKVGDVVKGEAEFMRPTEAEQRAIEAGKAAKVDLETLLGQPPSEEGERRAEALVAVIRAGKQAAAALSSRRAKRRAFGVQSKNKGKIEAMIDCLGPHKRRPPEAFNPDPMLVATRSHTLRFVRELDPECPDPDAVRWRARVEAVPEHSRDDLLTAVIPVDYDPAATCPRWLAALARFQPDEATRRTVQQFTGLGLTALPVQRVMYHVGPGANFKSTFLETVTRLLGESLAIGLPAESLTGQDARGAGQASPDLARVFGKNMLRVLEMPDGVPMQASTIKKLTGGEKWPVRTLFKGYFEFMPHAKTHMSGNSDPTFDGSDGGMKRRLVMVPWTVVIPKDEQRDSTEVIGEFMQEAPGILNWLIEGALDFLAQGLVESDDVLAKTRETIDDMDPVGQFYRAHVRPSDNPEDGVAARAMYNAFKAFCDANGKRAMYEARFGRTMKKICPRDDTGRVHVYRGVTLHDVPETEPQEPPPHAGRDDLSF